MAIAMKILLTGASGFIGSYMLPRLLDAGHEVTVIQHRQQTLLAPYVSRCKVIDADLTQRDGLDALAVPDMVIHLAAATDEHCKDPLTAVDINVRGTRNLIDFCVRNNVRSFVYFSTFQVYGTVEGSVSDDAPVVCMNDYSVTHWFAEELLRVARLRGELDYLILRPTNVYGPIYTPDLERWGLVPACLCKEAVESGSITLRSSGLQWRDFISVAEVSRAVLILVDRFDQWKNRSFILASGKSLTILDVAKIVQRTCEQSFDRPCALRVQSEVPLAGPPLQVNAFMNTLLAGNEPESMTLESVSQDIMQHLMRKG